MKSRPGFEPVELSNELDVDLIVRLPDDNDDDDDDNAVRLPDAGNVEQGDADIDGGGEDPSYFVLPGEPNLHCICIFVYVGSVSASVFLILSPDNKTHRGSSFPVALFQYQDLAVKLVRLVNTVQHLDIGTEVCK